MYILGISSFYHDSAATLIKDGRVIFAAEEERFTRIKHDNRFPFRAIEACLYYEKLPINQIDYAAYYEKPLLKFERILQTFVETYPFSLQPFIKTIPEWLGEKIKVKYIFRKKLKFDGRIFFIPHHLSHASAAYYPSPFKKSAILTADATGEYQTTALWHAKNNDIKLLKSINFPHSLGLLYSTFTAFLGFKVNEDEYKMMGLSAYGKPIYKNKILKILDIRDDGSFNLDMSYFSYHYGNQMWSKKFIHLFGKPRLPYQPINKYHKDLASSIQFIFEEIYFKILNHLYKLTKSKNLCIGGGVALNALANGKIYEKTPFKNIYIFGAAGDSGGAVGSALFAYHNLNHNSPSPSPSPSGRGDGVRVQDFDTLSLGLAYANNEIESLLRTYSSSEGMPDGIPESRSSNENSSRQDGYQMVTRQARTIKILKFDNESKLCETVASLLAKGKIIGWFQGRMEFGPRALGKRSILAKPNPASVRDKVNRIKIRELFRPFAGSILQENVHEYFEVPKKKYFSSFMTFCFKVKKEKRLELAAIVHKDNTCRIQTVNIENGRYYKLIKTFYKLTGIPCILNTSFNLKGEPIVENPKQAIEDFLKTKMDCLVIEDFLVLK